MSCSWDSLSLSSCALPGISSQPAPSVPLILGQHVLLVSPASRTYFGCLKSIVVSQSVDLGQRNNPNTTPTKDYENVRVVVYLHGVQRGCAEEGERGSTPTG